MRRAQFRLRSLFFLTAVVAVGCAAGVTAMKQGLDLIEVLVIGSLTAFLFASRWPKDWNDRRTTDRQRAASN